MMQRPYFLSDRPGITTMDVLSDVLNAVRLRSTVFAQTELPSPWGIRAEAREHFAFHIVSRGRCWLEVDGSAPIQVGAGDVVVLAPGRGHTLRDAPGSTARSFQELMAAGVFVPLSQRNSQATDGAATHLVCGCFHFETPGSDV